MRPLGEARPTPAVLGRLRVPPSSAARRPGHFRALLTSRSHRSAPTSGAVLVVAAEDSTPAVRRRCAVLDRCAPADNVGIVA